MEPVGLNVPGSEDDWVPTMEDLPFHRLGGEEEVRALAEAFYDAMDAHEPARRGHETRRRWRAYVAWRSIYRGDEMASTRLDPGPSDLAARHDLLVAALLKKARAPRCGRCGMEAPQRQWRCRGCGAFDSY